MFTQSHIQWITQLALKNFHDGIRPDFFAAIAAHRLAVDAAAYFNQASADAAGFVAISSMIDLTRSSAHLAFLSTALDQKMKQTFHSNSMNSAFNALKLNLENIHVDKKIRKIYQTTFNTNTCLKARNALYAACATYPHIWAISRAAYIHALACAANTVHGPEQDTVFKTAVTTRLSNDLHHQAFPPSFLMRFFTSPVMTVIGTLFLAVGITALSLGLIGFVVTAMAALMMNITGLNCAAVITFGAISTVSSLGFFGIKHCYKNQLVKNNMRCQESVDKMNFDFQMLEP